MAATFNPAPKADDSGLEAARRELSAQGIECSTKCCGTQALAGLLGFALFVIGCVAAAGHFPGATVVGGIAIGFSAAIFALGLFVGDPKKRKAQLVVAALIAAVMMTVGALGIAGVLSSTQVGYGIIGTSLASAPFNMLANHVSNKAGQKKLASRA